MQWGKPGSSDEEHSLKSSGGKYFLKNGGFYSSPCSDWTNRSVVHSKVVSQAGGCKVIIKFLTNSLSSTQKPTDNE